MRAPWGCLGPFQETSSCRQAPLSGAREVGHGGNYRPDEALGRRGWHRVVGGVAAMTRSKGVCRHQGLHKVAPSRPLQGVLGWGMTSPGANQGFPQPLSLLWGLFVCHQGTFSMHGCFPLERVYLVGFAATGCARSSSKQSQKKPAQPQVLHFLPRQNDLPGRLSA